MSDKGCIACGWTSDQQKRCHYSSHLKLFYGAYMDVEWKNLLQERLGAHDEGHEDAKAFWKDLCNLKQYLDLDEKGRETLKRLS